MYAISYLPPFRYIYITLPFFFLFFLFSSYGSRVRPLEPTLLLSIVGTIFIVGSPPCL